MRFDFMQYAPSCLRFQLDFKHPERDEVQRCHLDLRVANRYHAAAESFVVGRGSAAVFPGHLRSGISKSRSGQAGNRYRYAILTCNRGSSARSPKELAMSPT